MPTMSFMNGCSLLIGTSEVHSVYQCTKMFAFGTLVAAGQSPSLSLLPPPHLSPYTILLFFRGSTSSHSLSSQPSTSTVVFCPHPPLLPSNHLHHGIFRYRRSFPSPGEHQVPHRHGFIRTLQCFSPTKAYQVHT